MTKAEAVQALRARFRGIGWAAGSEHPVQVRNLTGELIGTITFEGDNVSAKAQHYDSALRRLFYRYVARVLGC